ncbi:MAG: LysR substrate-binding domain-containing protein, partial [Pseudomonadota bacterium]
RAWSARVGAPEGLIDDADAAGRAITFGDANLLLAAAMSGQGVALGDPITCADALETGRLTRPFAGAAPSERAYFIEVAPAAPAAATRFADWMTEAFQAAFGSSPSALRNTTLSSPGP